MICYRDMTFCDESSCVKWGKCHKCHRALTPEVRKAAEEWWGNKNYPISIFLDKPDCFEEGKK